MSLLLHYWKNRLCAYCLCETVANAAKNTSNQVKAVTCTPPFQWTGRSGALSRQEELNVVALAMRAWSQLSLQVLRSQMPTKAVTFLPLGWRWNRRTSSRLLAFSWPMDLSYIVFNDECSEPWSIFSDNGLITPAVSALQASSKTSLV